MGELAPLADQRPDHYSSGSSGRGSDRPPRPPLRSGPRAIDLVDDLERQSQTEVRQQPRDEQRPPSVPPPLPPRGEARTLWDPEAPTGTIAPTPGATSAAEGASAAEGGSSPTDWGDSYRLYADFVWRSLRRMGLSTDDAQDALHEVFLVWYRRRDSFDPSRGSMKSWLFGIAANVVRAEKRKQRRADPHPDAQDCFGGSGAQRNLVAEGSWRTVDGAGQTAAGDLKRALTRAIGELPPEHRAVFVMFEVEGVDCTTIARDLGIPVGTVYSRLHTSRRHLQSALSMYRAGAGGKNAEVFR